MNSGENSNETITSGGNISYWVNTMQAMSYKKPDHDMSTDVLVIGGGIAGLSVAYAVARSGRQVVLVEDGYIGSGETGRTTAHLVTALDDRYYSLFKMFGEKKTKLIAESHAAAIDFIEDAVKREKIDCDFKRVPGYLFLHPSDNANSIKKEFDATRKAGIEISLVEGPPGVKQYYGPALEFPRQARFHPMRYLKGLCDAIERYNGILFTHTHAKEIDHTGIVTESGFKISADHIVVATNTPVNDRFSIHLKQYPMRTYVIGAKVKKGSLPDVLWWDTGDFDLNSDIPPYHYVRLEEYNDKYDLLICGGEDHPVGLPEKDGKPVDRFQLLVNWAKEHFPIEDIVSKWSGQVMEPMDSMGYIGRNPHDKGNVYIVTGDSGNGMTHGTIAGMLISDLINGIKNDWENIYDPSRLKLLTAGVTMFKELVGNMISYYRNKQVGGPNELFDIEKLNGKVITWEGKKYGVYRDEKDEMHFVSADCTHLGCIVKWNRVERSWDCPCHGSRFSYRGQTMNGPANKALEYHKEKLLNIFERDYSKLRDKIGGKK
ncbi:MAG TPA: FAD-dependent oxidoreductase [Bacteroidia bacterium]|jgi:glycine/D-amino acid oxidase-like deaminating enzyme/nitrite reductase/ring-hydroxylating ferredoxin subunit